MNKTPVSVIILTHNEELNIGNCLKSIVDWVGEIFIVDGGPFGSYSDDKTLDIAKKYGVKITRHPFENQAQQFNWALDNLKIKNEWILRLDGDEYLTEELKKEIADVLAKAPTDITGFYIKRRVYFMGRWIKHGGYYPTWFLRLFRKNKAKYEEKEVDEHMVLLEGKTLKLKNDFIDDNRNKLEWWIKKQNNHSSREVLVMTNKNKNLSVRPDILSGQVGRKRWFKEKFYLKLPLFCRAFIYFFYRYFIRLGFLDAKVGLIFHFLQGFWYRFLVDAKLYEIKKTKRLAIEKTE